MSARSNKLIITGLVVVLLIIGNLYRLEKAEEQRTYEQFLNYLHGDLKSTIQNIENVIEMNPEGEALQNWMERLEENIEETRYTMKAGHLYLNLGTGNYFFRETTMMFHGVNFQGETLYDELPPYTQDNKLDDREKKILKTIKGYLVNFKEELEKPNGEVNEALSREELSDFVRLKLSKDLQEIYTDAVGWNYEK